MDIDLNTVMIRGTRSEGVATSFVLKATITARVGYLPVIVEKALLLKVTWQVSSKRPVA